MPTLEALSLGNEKFAFGYEEIRGAEAYQIKQAAGGRLYHICGTATPEELREEIINSRGWISGVIHPETQIVRDTMRSFLAKTFKDPELAEELQKFRGLTGDEVRRAGLSF